MRKRLKMNIQHIKNLKNQTEGMALTFVNLKEAIQALCNITIELTKALNEIQRDLDN